MDMIVYLLLLFGALLAGVLAAATKILPLWTEAVVDRMLTYSLYLLLFSMGIKTGLIENIRDKLSHIGISAVIYAAAASIGSAAAVAAAGFILNRVRRTRRPLPQAETAEAKNHAFSLTETLHHLKDPAFLIVIVIIGALLSNLTGIFDWYDDRISEALLYVLLFLVGVQMVHNRTDFASLFRDPVAAALPVLTIVGTAVGVSLVPLFTDASIREAMAVGAGYGWYSLSGVLIADLGNPVLGSVAFLSNLFRESIAFIMVPLLAGYKLPRAAISVCGATSMDVTLPIVEKYCGVRYVPLSLAHGVLLTIAVPVLVPLFYGIQ